MAVFVAAGVLAFAYYGQPFAVNELLDVLRTDGIPQLVAIWLGIISWIACDSLVEPKLKYSNRRPFGIHKGLHSFTGHSQAFTEAVERIIHDSE